MVRYFKKYDTRIKVLTGAGFAIPFQEIYVDGALQEWGIFATEDHYVMGELDKLIARQAGGVAEISAQEYEELKLKKKDQKSLPSWREIISPRAIQRILLKDLEDAAAAARRKPLPSVVTQKRTESQHLSRPMGISSYRPQAVAR